MWGDRGRRLLLPSVFGTHKMVYRKLQAKELLKLLDIVGCAGTDRLTVTDLLSIEHPGKIFAVALEAAKSAFVGRRQQDGDGNSSGTKWQVVTDLDTLAPVRDSNLGPRLPQLSSEPDQSQEQRVPEHKPRKLQNRELDTHRDRVSGVRPPSPPSAFTTDSKGVPVFKVPEGVVDVAEDHAEACALRFNTASAKATKSDSAAVPEWLWNEQTIKALQGSDRETSVETVAAGMQALPQLRKFFLGVWRRRVFRSFYTWLRSTGHTWSDRGKEILQEALRKVVYHVYGCTWWAWKQGSIPFFWRWPREFLLDALIGVPPRFSTPPPTSSAKQTTNPDPDARKLEKEKIDKALRAVYLVPTQREQIKCLMHYFSVPKGPTDIRMVYDSTRSGLNEATWVPWFGLPTIESLERTLDIKSWQGDNDFGEMFLNHVLHVSLQKFTGVDLWGLLSEDERKVENRYAWWTRPAMGLKGSPYQACQACTRAKFIVLGKRGDPNNPFAWHYVSMNLPGSKTYEPGQPWICKRTQDGNIAADILLYVDDARIVGWCISVTWQASMRMGKICSYLGLQDAARKRREPSQQPGAWSGAVVIVEDGKLVKMVSQERWDKAKTKLRWILAYVNVGGGWTRDDEACPEGFIPFKTLESIRGFYIYVSRTYKAMVPYLKGIHLTLDGWRKNRAEDGWRKEDKTFGDGWFFGEEGHEPYTSPNESDETPPSYVKVLPRLCKDVEALSEMFTPAYPSRIPVRASAARAAYLIRDASGEGFGSMLFEGEDQPMDIEYGTWTPMISKKSSNYREMGNLVTRVERLVSLGKLPKGTELFIFTDNFVTEAAFFRGSAKTRALHGLIQRLRVLMMRGSLHVHVVWIAGTRMIAQGTDGLSRGDLTSGVLLGDSFLQHVPIHRSVQEVSPGCVEWFMSCFPLQGHEWKLLTPHDWFDMSEEDGAFVWVPPPVLADVAVEKMAELILARPWNFHMFLAPALMTARWQRYLRKSCNWVLTIPCGTGKWPSNCHEPLVFSLAFPLLSRPPWQVKRDADLAKRFGEMQRVWSADWSNERADLCELWLSAAPIDPSMRWGVASPLL